MKVASRKRIGRTASTKKTCQDRAFTLQYRILLLTMTLSKEHQFQRIANMFYWEHKLSAYQAGH